LTHK